MSRVFLDELTNVCRQQRLGKWHSVFGQVGRAPGRSACPIIVFGRQNCQMKLAKPLPMCQASPVCQDRYTALAAYQQIH